MDYLEASLDNPASWYKHHEAKEGLMVLFTKHPTLDKNRASLTIQKAYQQLYETDKIYRVIDKVSFNPPENNSYRFMGSALHWDVSLRFANPFQITRFALFDRRKTRQWSVSLRAKFSS